MHGRAPRLLWHLFKDLYVVFSFNLQPIQCVLLPFKIYDKLDSDHLGLL